MLYSLGRGDEGGGLFFFSAIVLFFCYYFISVFETRSHSVTQVTLTCCNPPASASLGFCATPTRPFYASQQCMKYPVPPSSCQYSLLKARALLVLADPWVGGGGRFELCLRQEALGHGVSTSPGPSSSHPLLLCCGPLSP